MKRILSLLSLLLLALSMQQAYAGHGKGDCCKKGYFCCGSRCLKDELKSKVLCPAVIGGCCKDPPKGDVCEQEPKVSGPCKAYFPMWSWNPKTHKCERFVWGGCGGNDNRFETKEACYRKCYKKPKDDPKDCCRKGYFCCGKTCLKNGTQTFAPCGRSKCCKKGCRKTGCRRGYYCCYDRCVSKWLAIKKGCIRS